MEEFEESGMLEMVDPVRLFSFFFLSFGFIEKINYENVYDRLQQRYLAKLAYQKRNKLLKLMQILLFIPALMICI